MSNVSPSAAAAIAGALFAKSIDDCLEGLSDAERQGIDGVAAGLRV